MTIRSLIEDSSRSYFDNRRISSLFPISDGHLEVGHEYVRSFAESRGLRALLSALVLFRVTLGSTALSGFLDRAGEYRVISKAGLLLSFPVALQAMPNLLGPPTVGRMGTGLGGLALAISIFVWSFFLSHAEGDLRAQGPRVGAGLLVAAMAGRSCFVIDSENIWSSVPFYGFRLGLLIFSVVVVAIHFGPVRTDSSALQRRYFYWWGLAGASLVQGLVQFYELLYGVDAGWVDFGSRLAIALVLLMLARDVTDYQNLGWAKGLDSRYRTA